MRHRSMRAVVTAAVIVLAPTTAFACIGGWESWASAQVEESLAAAKRPRAELAEVMALRQQAARLMSERRYDEATPVLKRAMGLLHIKDEGYIPTRC